MALEGSLQPGEPVYEDKGVQFVVDQYSLSVMQRIAIDYHDGPYGGFTLDTGGPPAGEC